MFEEDWKIWVTLSSPAWFSEQFIISQSMVTINRLELEKSRQRKIIFSIANDDVGEKLAS